MAPSGVCTTSGWNMRRIDAPLLVGRHRERRVLARRLDGEAVGQARDAVAVAHPHRIALADLPDAVEQRRRFLDVHLGAAELGRMTALDDAAELHGRRLLAIADRQDRQAAVEHALRRPRRAVGRHRGGAAGQHDRLRLEARHGRLGLVERHDLRVDARLAHAARNELRHLTAEVDDKDGVGHGRSKVNALSGPIDHPPGGASRRAGAAIRQGFQGAQKNSLRHVDSCLGRSTCHQSEGVEPGSKDAFTGRTTMRFMVMVKATKDSEAGVMPSEEMLGAMGKFNEELVKAGVMLDGNGLQPSSKGARIQFSGRQAHGHRRPVRGNQGAGRRLLDHPGANPRPRPIEWMKRCPNPHNEDGVHRDPPAFRARRLRRQRGARPAPRPRRQARQAEVNLGRIEAAARSRPALAT